MDVKFINPFITSCRQVFDTMVHVPLSLDKPFLKKRHNPLTVTTVIGLSGGVNGFILFGFPTQVAVALASGLTGAPVAGLDSDCVDALGEIANMIAGGAKKDIPGGLTSLTTPSVHLGDCKLDYPPGVPVIVIPCQTKIGSFFMEVALQPATSAVLTASVNPVPPTGHLSTTLQSPSSVVLPLPVAVA